MRAFWLGWMGLMGVTAVAGLGGCLTDETYPGEKKVGGGGAGGTGGTGGTSDCTQDEDCMGKSVAACHKPVCSGGICSEEPDDDLAPTDDGNPCTTDTCVNGVETHTNNDEPCGSNPPMTHCDRGRCIGCEKAEDCAEVVKTECKVWSCSTEQECVDTNAPTDLFADPVGDCTKRLCSDTGMLDVEADLTDIPADDGNECTKEECQGQGMPVHTSQAGQACGAGPTCLDGAGTEQDKCDATGVCVTGASADCAPYACDATACKTSCMAPTDCVATSYCDGSQSKCFDKKASGATCVSGEECSTTFCTADDQVCCASACTAPCKSCNVGGTPGTCGNLSKGVMDKCPGGQVCNDNGGCTGAGGKAAVGQPCTMSSDCFNHQSGGLSECINMLCRLHVGEACEPAKPHECDTNLCDLATHTCQECTDNNDCPSRICDMAMKRCLFAMGGGPCGNDNDCQLNHPCTASACQ